MVEKLEPLKKIEMIETGHIPIIDFERLEAGEIISVNTTPNIITIDASQYAKQVSIAFAEWISEKEHVYENDLDEIQWYDKRGEGIGNSEKLFEFFIQQYKP